MADKKLTSRVYFGESPVGKAHFAGANYVKIDTVAPLESDTSGYILEYGAGFDVSDVVNNPPKLIGSDGNEITSLDGQHEITRHTVTNASLNYIDSWDNTLTIYLANGLPYGTWYYVED